MSKYITKFPVNWVDGMKVHKGHFLQEANATFDHIRDAISVRTDAVNYGILPPDAPNDKPSLKFWVEASNQNSISVKIMECQAITYGGIRISITDKEQEPFFQTVQIPEELTKGDLPSNKYIYLLLTVNPYQKVPFGEIDPEEEPPRYPFTDKEYRLSILGEEELAQESSSYQLVIAKLNYQNGLVESKSDYVPPCISLKSHPILMEQHLQVVNYLLGLEHSSLQIIRKILSKKQNNLLAQIVKHICENILAYLATNISVIKEASIHHSPFEMLAILAGLGRTIKNTIERYHGIGKEELLNYLSDWLDMTQVDFERLSSHIMNINYNHQDCQESLQRSLHYMNRMDTLFKKLAELDYIGKKDDTDVFVGLNRDSKQLTFWQRIAKRLFGL